MIFSKLCSIFSSYVFMCTFMMMALFYWNFVYWNLHILKWFTLLYHISFCNQNFSFCLASAKVLRFMEFHLLISFNLYINIKLNQIFKINLLTILNFFLIIFILKDLKLWRLHFQKNIFFTIIIIIWFSEIAWNIVIYMIHL